ncbi:heparan-alpha-glucosaminide N-acetyltransferase domain-containing protein [Aeromicrobium sp. UC242_57]|uniref:heparan-alpha-glucosaminide N-acetyltransferase domain-containing protein n=1 Tax=Aeromicrobium sp. UC242_57 TaxID=3374624 RepID=UPI0037970216
MTSGATSRIDAVDLARGVALIGMMLVHLGPVWTGGHPPWGDVVAGGRAAPLFAMLAGVALSLVHRRDPRGAGSVRATCIRAAVLIVLGLVLGSLDDMPVYVILAFYGLMIVVALPFRGLPTWVLGTLGVVWAVIAPLALLWLQIHHGPVISEQASTADLLPPWSLVARLVVWGAYPALVWFAYVLVGLAVGRLDLTALRTSVSLVAAGAVMLVASLGIGWIAIAQGVFDDWAASGGAQSGWPLLVTRTPYPYDSASWRELWLVGEHTSRPLNVLSAIGSALVVIGLCALVLRLTSVSRLLAPLRAAGAMTLTLYTVHVLWTWRLDLEMAEMGYGSWLTQVVVLCGFALLWQRLVGRGPLESAVRWLSVTAWSTRARDRINT